MYKKNSKKDFIDSIHCYLKISYSMDSQKFTE